MDFQFSNALRYIVGTGGNCLTDEQAIQLIEICEAKLSRSKGHLYFCHPQTSVNLSNRPRDWISGGFLGSLHFSRVSYPGFKDDSSFRNIHYRRSSELSIVEVQSSSMFEIDHDRRILVQLDWDLKIQPGKIHLQIPRGYSIAYSDVEKVLGDIVDERKPRITINCRYSFI